MISPTPKQKRAAEAPGSIAVTAGAGTGKTRMLAERYLFHVESRGLSPLSVVAVTFTEKAAAELRSRIRSTLVRRVSDDDVIAEVEAAQISTIHALAARICRDFYDIAGLPANFAVLDETESPLWFGEKFAEAIEQLGLEVVDAIGHRKLIGLLQELLKDPLASEKPLARPPGEWHELLRSEKSAARATLLASAEWQDTCRAIAECAGVKGDKLEDIRCGLDSLISEGQTQVEIDALTTLLKGFSIRLGNAKNWEPVSLERLRRCIFAFKERVKTAAEICSLNFGPLDDELAERLPLLATAFRQTRGFIAEAKIKDKVLDFNDLEHYALKVLENDGARSYYAERWKAFLIDEFQDTNPIQAEIIERLTDKAIVSIVGDEKQSIYGFRGADVEVFRKVRNQIIDAGGDSTSLDTTFRAHRGLVKAMNALFRPMLGDLHQDLTANDAETSHTKPFITFAGVADQRGSTEQDRRVLEARYIAGEIQRLREQGVQYSQIAILSRRWEPLNTYLDILSAQGIPAVNAGGGNLLATIEARDVYAMLQFVADPHDDIALISILRSPFFAISDKVLFDAGKSFVRGQSWWSLIQAMPVFSSAVNILREILVTSKTRSAETVLRFADRLTGYSAVIANLPQGPRRLADLEGVFDVLRKLALGGRGDVFGTVRYLRELYKIEIALPRPPVDPGEAVVLMTIHRAKGLEWPVVFVTDLASQSGGGSQPVLIDTDLGVAFKMDDEDNKKQEPVLYGLIKTRRKKRELDEARRILYVAITRAEHKVFLTAGREKGNDVDLLLPGIEAAGIETIQVPYEVEKTIAPAPSVPAVPDVPAFVDIEPVRLGLTELPVTALSTFAKCPARFRWQYVEGHPGIHDDAGTAMRIGRLTHTALENDVSSPAELAAFDPEASEEETGRALAFAGAFREKAVYEPVRAHPGLREVRFAKSFGPITLSGIADLVGGDFILDYKTDTAINSLEHRFQIWAYARGLNKPRGYIAYLAHDQLFEFRSEDLDAIDAQAAEILDRILRGDYTPTPSAEVCAYCNYKEICEFRYPQENSDQNED